MLLTSVQNSPKLVSLSKSESAHRLSRRGVGLLEGRGVGSAVTVILSTPELIIAAYSYPITLFVITLKPPALWACRIASWACSY